MPLLTIDKEDLIVSLDSDGELIRADVHVPYLDYYQECTERVKKLPTLMEKISDAFGRHEIDRALSKSDDWVKSQKEGA